tara:strand:- start:971 stop:1165 length:195 start_codon:yes stop_codon:yes gene_type:complete
MEQIKLNKVTARKEIFFKRKADSKHAFTISHYNRCDKTYTCENYETGAEIFLKSSTNVFIGFDY